MPHRAQLTKQVAVIGPFHNAAIHARAWLAALSFQTYRNFKVYAVDDASSDDTAPALADAGRGLGDHFELISLGENVGPSSARNLAIRRALADGAEIILLLDCDCRVTPNWIFRHVEFHVQNPNVAIMGGAIAGKAESVIGKADGFCSWFTAVPNTSAGRVRKLHLSSTNMSLKRSVFEKIGFFDENLATGEDVALCRRAQKAGLTLWFQSDVVVTHLDRNCTKDAIRHHFRWGLHSYTLSLQQHGGYYGVLKTFRAKWPVVALVPVIASLNTILILYKYGAKKPSVWFLIPWIFYLKWWNAIGVYRGFSNPDLCLRAASVTKI